MKIFQLQELYVSISLFFHQDGEGKAEKVDKKEKKEKKDDKEEKAEKKDKKDKKDKKEEKVKATPLQKDQERAKGLQLEEENEREEPEASVEDTAEVKRDTRKAWFFNKNYDMLPQAAKDLFDSKKVSRSDKTQLVNSMVQPSSSGKGWVLDTESPVLTALSRHFKSLVGEESLVSRVSTFLFLFTAKVLYTSQSLGWKIPKSLI